MNEVLILGAGFSKAISDHMPLTNPLGSQVIKAAGLEDDPRVPASGFDDNGVTFEAWLSTLAEDQPYLTERQNFENRATFSQIVEVLTSILTTAETKAIEAGPPPWFYDLLSAMHYTKATAITFNYDRLVEIGVATQDLMSESLNQLVRARPRDILWDNPPSPQTAGTTYDDMNPALYSTFRYLKLHGSLDWWWVPGDVSGATLSRAKILGSFRHPLSLSYQSQCQQFPGREQFVVPPLALKSAYYRNPLARDLWRAAFDALRAADRIALVGYSMPAADLVVSGMLGAKLREGSVPIEIVNPTPQDLPERLKVLGANAAQIEFVASVKQFARRFCDRASAEVLASLRAIRPELETDTTLLVARNQPLGLGARAVSSIGQCESDGTIEIRLDDSELPDGPTGRQYVEGSPVERKLPTLAQLLAAATDANRMVVRVDGNTRVPIVGTWRETRESGERPRWLSLTPAGHPHEPSSEL